MKFQKTQTQLKGEWRYQAQFCDGKAMKRASEWLAFRPCGEVLSEGANIYTNDLQTIFELRVHFDATLKIIRQYQPA